MMFPVFSTNGFAAGIADVLLRIRALPPTAASSGFSCDTMDAGAAAPDTDGAPFRWYQIYYAKNVYCFMMFFFSKQRKCYGLQSLKVMGHLGPSSNSMASLCRAGAWGLCLCQLSSDGNYSVGHLPRERPGAFWCLFGHLRWFLKISSNIRRQGSSRIPKGFRTIQESKHATLSGCHSLHCCVSFGLRIWDLLNMMVWGGLEAQFTMKFDQ